MNLFAVVNIKTNRAVDYAADKMAAKAIRNNLNEEAAGGKEDAPPEFKVSVGPDHRHYQKGHYKLVKS